MNVGDASDFHVVESEIPHKVHRAGLTLEVCSAQVASFGIESDAELRTSAGVGELDVHVAAIDPLFERGYRFLRSQARLDGMIVFRQPLNGIVPGIGWWRGLG